MEQLYYPNRYKITYRFVESDEMRFTEVTGPYQLCGALTALCGGENIKNIDVFNVEIVSK